jgi:hypothetical protein
MKNFANRIEVFLVTKENGRRGKLKKVLARPLRALLLEDNPREGGVLYDKEVRSARMIFATNKGEKPREYEVRVVAERDSTWIVEHRRPSGRTRRVHRRERYFSDPQAEQRGLFELLKKERKQ